MNPSTLDTDALYSNLGADPDLAEIVEMFVDEMPARTADLIDCLESGDWERLARAAHQMKGAAGSYGFDAITPTAARLEAAVRETRPEDEIREALEELVTLCGKVRAGAPE